MEAREPERAKEIDPGSQVVEAREPERVKETRSISFARSGSSTI